MAFAFCVNGISFSLVSELSDKSPCHHYSPDGTSTMQKEKNENYHLNTNCSKLTQIAQVTWKIVWWNLSETARIGLVGTKNKLFLMKKPTRLEFYS